MPITGWAETQYHPEEGEAIQQMRCLLLSFEPGLRQIILWSRVIRSGSFVPDGFLIHSEESMLYVSSIFTYIKSSFPDFRCSSEGPKKMRCIRPKAAAAFGLIHLIYMAGLKKTPEHLFFAIYTPYWSQQ